MPGIFPTAQEQAVTPLQTVSVTLVSGGTERGQGGVWGRWRSPRFGVAGPWSLKMAASQPRLWFL